MSPLPTAAATTAEDAAVDRIDEVEASDSTDSTATSELSWQLTVTWRRRNSGDVKIADPSSTTILGLQVALGNASQVNSLLKLRADPSARDQDGDRTPLHWAAARCRVGTVSMLVDAGADSKLCDAGGRTPAELARRFGSHSIAMYLEFGPPCPDPKRVFEGLDGLSLQVALNDERRVRKLIHTSADPSARDVDQDRTPLHWAAARGRVAAAKCLINANASLLERDAAGRLPVELAHELRHGDVHALLLSAASGYTA